MLQFLLFVSIFLIAGCGRKRKDLFVFEKNREQTEILRRLETVKQITAKTQQDGSVLIKWSRPLFQEQKSERFLGYNVYRLRSWGIIPRKPLNRAPLMIEFFRDRQVLKNECCYAVCMVFVHDKKPYKSYEGPMSKIVS